MNYETPTPVNIRHHNGDALYCGRGRGGYIPSRPGGRRGWLGNPIRVGTQCPECGEVHGKGETLSCYETYLRRKLEDQEWRTHFLKAVGQAKHLGCFCKPSPCHTDVIAAVYSEVMVERFVERGDFGEVVQSALLECSRTGVEPPYEKLLSWILQADEGWEFKVTWDEYIQNL